MLVEQGPHRKGDQPGDIDARGQFELVEGAHGLFVEAHVHQGFVIRIIVGFQPGQQCRFRSAGRFLALRCRCGRLRRLRDTASDLICEGGDLGHQFKALQQD